MVSPFSTREPPPLTLKDTHRHNPIGCFHDENILDDQGSQHHGREEERGDPGEAIFASKGIPPPILTEAHHHPTGGLCDEAHPGPRVQATRKTESRLNSNRMRTDKRLNCTPSATPLILGQGARRPLPPAM